MKQILAKAFIKASHTTTCIAKGFSGRGKEREKEIDARRMDLNPEKRRFHFSFLLFYSNEMKQNQKSKREWKLQNIEKII